MEKQRAAVLFSGGKDSCLALHLVLENNYDVRYLLSVIPENFDSFMFHKPDLRLLGKQAEMLNLELVVMGSKGEEGRELGDLKKLIEQIKDEIEVIVIGGIASSYQGKRIKKICDDLNLKFYAPLWNYKSEDVWKKLLGLGFKVILTKIACEGLGKEWLGVVIDEKKLFELKRLSEKFRFRIDFEGGEAESAVLEMPEFKKDIKIKYKIESEGEYRCWIDIRKIE